VVGELDGYSTTVLRAGSRKTDAASSNASTTRLSEALGMFEEVACSPIIGEPSLEIRSRMRHCSTLASSWEAPEILLSDRANTFPKNRHSQAGRKRAFSPTSRPYRVLVQKNPR
jgi:hypothetical protein